MLPETPRGLGRREAFAGRPQLLADLAASLLVPAGHAQAAASFMIATSVASTSSATCFSSGFG